MHRVLLTFVVLLALAAAAALFAVAQWWRSPLPVGDAPVLVTMAPGETLGAVSARLSREGVLQYPQLLNLIARFQGADARLRSGEYSLEPGSTPADLLQQLQSGDTVRYTVTLPEGITLARALQILRSEAALVSVLSGPRDPALLALVAPVEDTEGFFLPETYQYQRNDTDLSILTQANVLMRQTLETLWNRRDPALPFSQAYDALVLASIVERETGVATERPEIAGVFLRRLDRGMRLQTDPTVIYGLGEEFDGNLTRQHLRDASNPYNTYRHHGLPPGPIALPGSAALEAVFNPAAGSSLYFVARGDGSHVFSDTLEAHERAVAEYQLRRRADYRSAPDQRSAQDKRSQEGKGQE